MLCVFSGPGEGGCLSSDCERVLADLSLDTGTQFLCLKIFLGADVSPCDPSPGTALWLSGVYAEGAKHKARDLSYLMCAQELALSRSSSQTPCEV